MTIRAILALLVLAADTWALLRLYGSAASAGRKAMWSAAIVLLPVVGILLWLRSGPRPSERARRVV